MLGIFLFQLLVLGATMQNLVILGHHNGDILLFHVSRCLPQTTSLLKFWLKSKRGADTWVWDVSKWRTAIAARHAFLAARGSWRRNWTFTTSREGWWPSHGTSRFVGKPIWNPLVYRLSSRKPAAHRTSVPVRSNLFMCGKISPNTRSSAPTPKTILKVFRTIRCSH